MNAKLLSICIPTYNRNDELKKLYDNFLSIVAKNLKDDIEIIVCDNSIPHKANINERLFKDTGVTYYANEKNLGFAGNVLKCYRLARGKFIWLLPDNDDILTDEFFRLFKYLKMNQNNIDAVFLRFKWQDVFYREQTSSFPKVTCINDFFKQNIVPFVLLSNAIVRRNLDNFDIIAEKFSNNDFVQIVLHSMAINQSQRLSFYPNPIIYYHVEYVGRFNLENIFNSMHDVLKFLLKHFAINIAKLDYKEYIAKQRAVLSHDLGVNKIYEIETIRKMLLDNICKYKGLKAYAFYFLLKLPQKMRTILYGVALLLASPRTIKIYPKYLLLKKRIRETQQLAQ